VELLIVIVIIGILVSMAIVSYEDMNESAQAATCKENQIAVEAAASLYYANQVLTTGTGNFPTMAQLVSGGFLDKSPKDPINHANYEIDEQGKTACPANIAEHARR
jgi:Tfp pilus assembly protein PilE